MNIPLPRLIDAIIATMRSDVIPHVSDSYARGQAVGVIDLLNNLAPRVEWAQAPLAALVRGKTDLLREVVALVPEIGDHRAERAEAATAEELMSLNAELDGAIGDALAAIWPRRGEENCARAVALIKARLHDDAAAELKKTRKPLFAEIAGGDDKAKS